MKIIRGLKNLKPQSGSVVTIGNFDGVHKGHKKIILRLTAKAKEKNLPSVLISFAPTPQQFFGNEQALLSSFKEKYHFLSNLGVDIHLIIHFNQAFSQLTAQDFVQAILCKQLGMQHCLIGDDFHFGKNRQGDFSLLQDLAKTNNFTVENTRSILYKNRRISSSNIRLSLKQGDMATASAMLGREFSIFGTIVHGLKNGRTIGFPTINIPIKRKISPVHGIFSVTVELGGITYQGVCSVGNRPVINGTETLLEVFLFDFNQQVYGLDAKITFKHKIRDERNFDDFTALKKQIELDVQDTKRFFNAL